MLATRLPIPTNYVLAVPGYGRNVVLKMFFNKIITILSHHSYPRFETLFAV